MLQPISSTIASHGRWLVGPGTVSQAAAPVRLGRGNPAPTAGFPPWLRRWRPPGKNSLHQIVGVLAVILLLLVLQDAFEVMLLPRRVERRRRLMGVYFRLAWQAWSRLANKLSGDRRRESMLSHFGPLSMIGLFALWAVVLIIGFGTLEWSLQPQVRAVGGLAPWIEQVYMSGVTFFTLGYGDVVPHTDLARLVAVIEAGMGIGFIAIVIGYLPVLYQLFSRREAHLIQLDARAGSPPTAVAMLCRHAEAGGLAKLDELLREWEVWSAELLESHLSYPMLAYYRSQHDNQSWLAALIAIMDCCALILIGVKDLQPLQARMTFGMARQVVVEMARSLQSAPSRYDGGDRLSPEAFDLMLAHFAEARLEWDGGPDAQSILQALRSTYEPLMDGLARHLLLTLPGWLPDEHATDHSAQGHRGLLARRLIEELVNRDSVGSEGNFTDATNTWRKLRRQLRRK